MSTHFQLEVKILGNSNRSVALVLKISIYLANHHAHHRPIGISSGMLNFIINIAMNHRSIILKKRVHKMPSLSLHYLDY